MEHVPGFVTVVTEQQRSAEWMQHVFGEKSAATRCVINRRAELFAFTPGDYRQ